MVMLANVDGDNATRITVPQRFMRIGTNEAGLVACRLGMDLRSLQRHGRIAIDDGYDDATRNEGMPARTRR